MTEPQTDLKKQFFRQDQACSEWYGCRLKKFLKAQFHDHIFKTQSIIHSKIFKDTTILQLKKRKKHLESHIMCVPYF